MYRSRDNSNGLMGFVHLKGFSLSSTNRTVKFSHIGVIVPDIVVAQERMDKLGVKIVKRVGEVPKAGGELDNVFALGDDMTQNEEAIAAASKGIVALGLPAFLVVEDPDRNLVGIQQQN